MPTRHLATIEGTGEGYLATCVCGWEGDRLAQRGDALIAAHVHTRHVQPPPGFADEQLPYQLALPLGDDLGGTVGWAHGDGRVDATGLQDARVTRRSW